MADERGWWRAAREVARAEVRRIARDRRALISAVLLPALIYPLVFHGQAWLRSFSQESMSAREVRVALDLRGAPPEVVTGLEQRLSAEVPIELVTAREAGVADEASALRELLPGLHEGRPLAEESERNLAARVLREVDLLILAAPHPVLPARLVLRVHHDGSDETSNEALARARRALADLEESRRGELLSEALGADDPARGLDLLAVDVASPADTGGAALGRLLPLLAVLVLVSGGAFAALGAFAGERESGTLETLLVQPVPAAAVAWGKFYAVLLVAMAALCCNVGSLFVSLALGLGALPGLDAGEGTGLVLAVSGGRLALSALVFVPSAVTLCALLSLVSARARSFREGQHLLLPLSIGAAVPAAVAGWAEVALDPMLAIVPIFGPCLAMRDALRGSLEPVPAVITVLGSCVWAWLALRALGPTLDAERILQGGDVELESGERRMQSRSALRWGLFSVAVIYVAGGWLQSWNLLAGLMITLWVLLPVLAFFAVRKTARRAGESIPRALGLALPTAGHALGALLVAPALGLFARGLIAVQNRFIPLPSRLIEAGENLVSLDGLSPLALVFVMALSPGLCEDLLFRGAILSGLRRDLSPARAVLWQAVLFGWAHASVHRFLPTALVGVALGVVALRTKSLWPAVLLHVSYNALLVLSQQHAWLADPRLALLALPGIVLLARGREVRAPGEARRGPVAVG